MSYHRWLAGGAGAHDFNFLQSRWLSILHTALLHGWSFMSGRFLIRGAVVRAMRWDGDAWVCWVENGGLLDKWWKRDSVFTTKTFDLQIERDLLQMCRGWIFDRLYDISHGGTSEDAMFFCNLQEDISRDRGELKHLLDAHSKSGEFVEA